MKEIPFIDAHHHLWAPQSDPAGLGYVWLKDIGAMKPFGDPTPIQRDYLLNEFLGEASPRKMVGSVHVQCDPKLPDPVAETAFIQGISDASGHPIMIVGFADLTAEDFQQTVARHMAHPNLRGIRQIVSYLPNRPDISFSQSDLMGDLVWQSNFGRLADHRLSFDLQLYPEQMLQAADLLSRHPDIPVVIDHLGSPYDASDAGLRVWATGMQALCELPQVSVKMGGSTMFMGGDLGSRLGDLIRSALSLFGPERVMFASNFPVDSLHITYPDLLGFVASTLGDDETLCQNVMHDNAAMFYRFAC